MCGMCDGGLSTCVGGGCDVSPGDDAATVGRRAGYLPEGTSSSVPDAPAPSPPPPPPPPPASDPTGESAPCVDPPPFATDACAAAAASASRLSVTVLGSPGRGSGGSPPLAANVDSGLNPPKPGDAAPDCGPFAFASRPRTSHSFAIAATDPASDLASTSGIVRTSSGSPAHVDGGADGASDGAADAPRATLCDPSRTSSRDTSAVPGLESTVGSTLFSSSAESPCTSAQSSPTATVPAARIASSSSSTRPRYTSSPDATCTSRAHDIASVRSVSGGMALVSAHASSAAYSGERSMARDSSFGESESTEREVLGSNPESAEPRGFLPRPPPPRGVSSPPFLSPEK